MRHPCFSLVQAAGGKQHRQIGSIGQAEDHLIWLQTLFCLSAP